MLPRRFGDTEVLTTSPSFLLEADTNNIDSLLLEPTSDNTDIVATAAVFDIRQLLFRLFL